MSVRSCWRMLHSSGGGKEPVSFCCTGGCRFVLVHPRLLPGLHFSKLTALTRRTFSVPRIPLASGVPTGLWTNITPPQGRLSTSFNACSTSRMRAVGNVPASRSCPVCASIKRAGSSERT